MFENIRANSPNFCIGPQTGTYCTVHVENDPVVMHVKNESGTLIRIYDFFPQTVLKPGPYEYDDNTELDPTTGYFTPEIVTIKYIGPRDQTSFFDGAVFYTLEKRSKVYREYYTHERDPEPFGPYKVLVNAANPAPSPNVVPYEEYGIEFGELLTDDRPEYSSNIIRRWLLDPVNARLVLDKTYTKNSDSVDWFGGDAFAVENLVQPMTDHSARSSGEITVTTTSGLKKYDTLMLGPSSDTDNYGDIEEVYVHAINGDVVTVKTYEGYIPPKYDYVEGDMVTSFNDILLFGNTRPMINEVGIAYSIYQPIGTLFHLDQVDYGAVYHREYSGMYDSIKCSVWNGYLGMLSFVKGTNLLHLDMDDYEISRSQNIGLEYPIDNKFLPLYDLDIKDVTIYKLMESIVQRDDSGQYAKITWASYNYHEDSLLPYTFSVTFQASKNVLLIADRTYLTVTVRDQFGVGLLDKNIWITKEGDAGSVMQPNDGYLTSDSNGQAVLIYDSGYYTDWVVTVHARVDGSNITYGSAYVNTEIGLTQHSQYLVEIGLMARPYQENNLHYHLTKYLITEFDEYGRITTRHDGSVQLKALVSYMYPRNVLKNEYLWQEYSGGKDNNFPVLLRVVIEPYFSMKGQEPEIHAEVEFFLTTYLKLLGEQSSEVELNLPLARLTSSEHNISQNFISRHLLYGHTDNVDLDQYTFVQEAVPAMWSEKNNVDTTYWIRLRPFASDLDPATLVIKFREHSYLGMSDWYEVTHLGEIIMFDAGGGLLGIDFYYIPPVVFHHSAILYVSIEVYDTSLIPNKIIVDYWFKLIQDFNAPYIENHFPAVEAFDATINTDITFDLLDVGEGVDIDTLEVFVNNRSTVFGAEEFEHGNYHIVCELPYVFYFGQSVNVVVDVKDRSANANRLFDGWKFYCAESTVPWFNRDNVVPRPCIEGAKRDQEVSMQVYGVDDTGIEYDSIRVEVGGRYRRVTITPIVYRLS